MVEIVVDQENQQNHLYELHPFIINNRNNNDEIWNFEKHLLQRRNLTNDDPKHTPIDHQNHSQTIDQSRPTNK